MKALCFGELAADNHLFTTHSNELYLVVGFTTLGRRGKTSPWYANEICQ